MATNTENLSKHEVGQAFVERHQSEVIGVLHGWDRLRLQWTLRSLYYAPVMEQYLRKAGVMWKDFKRYATGLTGRVCQAAEELSKQCQRPVIYLASSQASKEDEARRIQQRDGIKSGLIAVMSCVEPCRTWRMRGNHETKRLELRLEWGKFKTVMNCIAVMQQRTERAVRACIKEMKDGTYYGESSTDDDGYELDVPVTVRCEATIKGDELTIDFSKSDKQRRGFINSSYPSTYSIAVAGAILFLDPALADYHNEGTMRALDIIAPEGLVVNAKYPAPMGGAPVNVGHNIIEAVMMAMSEALPGRAAAGWGRRYGQYIYGTNPRTGGLYIMPGYHAEGGAGAVAGYDGYQGAASIGTLGEISRPNTEDVEIKYPWKVISREFRMDSSGAGKWRGGPGFHWEVVNLGGEAGMHTGAGQGETTFSHGALGGKPTPPNTRSEE